MVFRTLVLQLAERRIPLIRFRKGGYQHGSGANQASPTAQATGRGKSAASASTAIEDWELPDRFRRKPMSPEEMEYINNGGRP